MRNLKKGDIIINKCSDPIIELEIVEVLGDVIFNRAIKEEGVGMLGFDDLEDLITFGFKLK